MRITVLGQPCPSCSLGNWIREQLRQLCWNSCLFVTAVVTNDAVKDLRSDLDFFACTGKEITIYTGLDLDVDTLALQNLLEIPKTTIYIIHNPHQQSIFHPKLYVFKNESQAAIAVSSANFTRAGLWYNFEIGLLVEVDLPQEISLLNDLTTLVKNWESPEKGLCVKLDSDILDQLRKETESPRKPDTTETKKLSPKLPPVFRSVPIPHPQVFSPRYFFMTILPGDLPQKGSSPEIRITKYIRNQHPSFWGWTVPPPPDPETGRSDRMITITYLQKTFRAVLRDFPAKKPKAVKASGDFRLGNIGLLWHAFKQPEDILMLERLDAEATKYRAEILYVGSPEHTSVVSLMTPHPWAKSEGFTKKYLYL